MKKYFCIQETWDCDCFVADYTNATDNKKGVVISKYPFEDIAYFHLKKINQNQNIRYIIVNLEEYPAFTKGAKNCECVFASVNEVSKPWVLFLETKYCDAKNIEGWTLSAIKQMKTTLSRLEEEGLIDRETHNIYFAYSVPGHDEDAPFGAFSVTQDMVLNMRIKEKITLFRHNTVLIATPQYLFEPKVPI